ncbi:MAG: histidinol dehydrogenase [Pseudohongiellaceae bacterium]
MTNPTLTIRRLDATAADFASRLQEYLRRDEQATQEINAAVAAIIADVRQGGDAAVLEYSRRFDGFEADTMQALSVSREQLQQALAAVSPEQRQALTHATERIRRYHEKQQQSSWHYTEADGSVYGQKITPVDRVGLYVPGGKANYPSSMLMLAIPAQVAGVGEIIATVPTRYAEDNLVFAAAALAGVERVFTIGGAQAIAALACGTETIPQVDKIAGPGNVYVTAAKRQVFGEVGIDMLAGPSELTIITDSSCDNDDSTSNRSSGGSGESGESGGGDESDESGESTADSDRLALDLFAQAEHDEQAQAILIATSPTCLDAVEASIHRLLPKMERREIIQASLNNRGFFVLAQNLEQAATISNQIAPEHLALSVADPEPLLEHIHHAAAIFLGHCSAEALGDYCAGPSHVLPTSGSARFCSALGVYDFQKRSSLISCSPEGADKLAPTAAQLARSEGLQAHALSAEMRRNSTKDQ